MKLAEPRWHLLNEGCGKGKINIFFAGSGFHHDLAYDVGVRRRLLSWHANTSEDIDQYIAAQEEGRESFGIIDSGAFTVWNKGGEISVVAYVKKLLKLMNHFDIAANLDVIPGKKGMPARDITPEITEAAAKAGWKNYLTIQHNLEKHGGFQKSRVMPIYHQGESIDWLKRMVDHGCAYIGISPSNDYHTSQRQHWLDDVFDYLSSLPKLPMTHGYAVTSPVLMEQYPWMSVDSSSWVQQGGYGTINTPYGVITLTDRESIMGKADAMGGRGWTSEMKEKVAAYLCSIGLDIEEVKKSHHERWKANAIHLLRWEMNMSYKRRMRSKGLFDDEIGIGGLPKKINLQKKVVGNDQADCFGIKTENQLGEIPMSLYDATSKP